MFERAAQRTTLAIDEVGTMLGEAADSGQQDPFIVEVGNLLVDVADRVTVKHTLDVLPQRGLIGMDLLEPPFGLFVSFTPLDILVLAVASAASHHLGFENPA
jgi:hypothetical protein